MGDAHAHLSGDLSGGIQRRVGGKGGGHFGNAHLPLQTAAGGAGGRGAGGSDDAGEGGLALRQGAVGVGEPGTSHVHGDGLLTGGSRSVGAGEAVIAEAGVGTRQGAGDLQGAGDGGGGIAVVFLHGAKAAHVPGQRLGRHGEVGNGGGCGNVPAAAVNGGEGVIAGGDPIQREADRVAGSGDILHGRSLLDAVKVEADGAGEPVAAELVILVHGGGEGDALSVDGSRLVRIQCQRGAALSSKVTVAVNMAIW